MTIDSNIIIGYLSGRQEIVKELTRYRIEGRTFLLPAVVEAEIFSYPKLTKSEISTIEHFAEENFLFVPLDRNIARIAASLRRTLTIKLPDSLIAATALATHTPLLTKNLKDFQKVPELKIAEL